MSSNVATITDQSNTITSMVYVAGSLQVSDGQSHDAAPSITPNGNVFTISLGADREKTALIANNFNSASGGVRNEYAGEGDDGVPSELNFFFAVDVTFTVAGNSTTERLYIGQGSFGEVFSINNWWLGGTAIAKPGIPKLQYAIGSKLYTLLLSGDEDSFTFTPANVRVNSPIKNVFVLMLENHSFDNFFAFSGISGLTVATTANSNSYTPPNGQNTTYNVAKGALPSMPTCPGHEFTDVVEQLCGEGKTYPQGGPYPAINNSGFVANYATTPTETDPQPGDFTDVMQCFDTASQLPIIYQLATQFAICDFWYSSLPGPTWPNRFFVHGASSNGLDHSPSETDITKWETADGFTYPHGSIYDEFKSGSVSFGLFNDGDGPIEGGVAQVAAIHNLSMFDVSTLDFFVAGLVNGTYPFDYTFIEPNYGYVTSTYEDGSSQHPIDGIARGEQLIQIVYEAIRNSNIWDQSLLIVTYDEHGGFYDSVAPPGGIAAPGDGSDPSNNELDFDFTQAGVRVPAVVISPWIQAQVDPTAYDHASVLATVEKLFGVKALTQRDAAANDVLHLISSTLRTDCPSSLGRPAPEAVRPPITAAHRLILDQQPLPERDNLIGFLGIAAKTDRELSGGTLIERAAIHAKVQSIKTRGQARAYIESVMTRAATARALIKRR
jgi:phospholipase C